MMYVPEKNSNSNNNNKEEIDIWNGKYKQFQMMALNIDENKVDHKRQLYTDENVQHIPFSKQNYMLMCLLNIILLMWHPGEALLLEP